MESEREEIRRLRLENLNYVYWLTHIRNVAVFMDNDVVLDICKSALNEKSQSY